MMQKQIHSVSHDQFSKLHMEIQYLSSMDHTRIHELSSTEYTGTNPPGAIEAHSFDQDIKHNFNILPGRIGICKYFFLEGQLVHQAKIWLNHISQKIICIYICIYFNHRSHNLKYINIHLFDSYLFRAKSFYFSNSLIIGNIYTHICNFHFHLFLNMRT